MSARGEETLQRDVGCAFCGLGCDDLAIDCGGDRLQVAAAGCELSRQRFAELRATSAAPLVDGRASDLASAVERAAELLAPSAAPAFVVAGDVAAARAVVALADRLGGVVDHPDSDALFHNLSVVQDSGALTTTLSEVRNRADLVLVVGPDPVAAFPRFYERCIEPQRTLFADGAPARALLRIGPPAAEASSTLPLIDELPCPMEQLPAVIAALRALARGDAVASDLPGLDPKRLQDLTARLQAARYGLIVWAPALFPAAGAPLVAHGLLELARTLTRTTRCSVLALGGSANLFGVNQVCTWQTGYPVRTSFARSAPEHDPYRYAVRRMLAAGEADALLWISAFDTARLPPPGKVPAILLAPPGATLAPGTAVYVPIGVPGVDHAGQIFRTDGVVALQLRALRKGALPSAAAVVNAIDKRLTARVASQ
jgi:formylmethanofuran dehydrogenase subunit B